MRKLLLSVLLCSFFIANKAFAQLPVTINFESKADWQLNVAVPALGATVPATNYILPESMVPIIDLLPESLKQAMSTEDNRWIINDIYTGGTVKPLEVKIQNFLDPTRDTLITAKFSDIPNTPAQPGSFSLPNKNYLHPISYYSANVSVPPVLSAHYLHDLAFKRKHFAMMKNSFSTLNFTDVKVSFWRVGGEGQSIYFSKDDGITWTLLATITGSEKNWKNQIGAHADLNNQGVIKLGILWDDALATEDATGIDEFSVTGTPLMVAPGITASISATTVCVGGSLPVTVTASGNFNAGNIFTAQLSDAAGNFANPTVIGTIAATATATATATIPSIIPAGMLAGSNYRIRVVSSSPAIVGPATAQVLAIAALPLQPQISVQGQTALCPGEKVVLTAPQASSYLWSNGAATQSIEVSQAGNYSVVVNNAAGCTSQASLPVSVSVNTIVPQPSVTLTGKTALCQGEKVILTAPLADGYIWSTGATSRSIEVSQPGNYTVKVKNASGCESLPSSVVAIAVHSFPAKPDISFSGPLSFCKGEKVILTAPEAAVYKWSTGAATRSITVGESGEYWVTTANTAACESAASDRIKVTVHDLPLTPVIIANGPVTFCEGGKVVLTAPEASSYLWSTGATTRSIEAVSTGSYTVKVSNANTCASENAIPVEVTVVPLPLKPVINVSGNTSFCEGESVVLTAPLSSAYLWSTGATSRSIEVRQQGNYRVRVMNTLGCESTLSDPVSTTVFGIPATPSIEQINLDTLSASVNSTLYEWRKDGVVLTTNTKKITVNENGNYSVRVKDANGCFSLWSPEVAFTVADKNSLNKVSLFPNPSPGEFTLLVENSSSPVLQVQVFSILGQSLLSLRYNNSAKDFRRKIEMPVLTPGTYVLRISMGKEVAFRKLVIQ